jgi:hypothetical protein
MGARPAVKLGQETAVVGKHEWLAAEESVASEVPTHEIANPG